MRSDPDRDVVVTGLGLIGALGADRTAVWREVLAGRPRMGGIAAFPPEPHGLERYVVAGIPPETYRAAAERVEERAPDARRPTRFQTLVLAACAEAVEDAGRAMEIDAPDPTGGIVLGTMYGSAAEAERATRAVDRGRRPRVSDTIARRPGIAGQLAGRALGIAGPTLVVDAACASGAYAVAAACRLLASGDASWCLAGGAEAGIVPSVVQLSRTLGVLSSAFREEPDRASRPFDLRRDGFVPAEGACFLVLETGRGARERGARVHARVLGFAEGTDPRHPTHLDPGFAARVMRLALERSGVGPGDLGWVKAHATSTPQGDVAEAVAIRNVIGERPIPTTAPKSLTGHLLGAAGAFELALVALALGEGRIPPTVNLDEPDPSCPVTCPAEAAPCDALLVLANSFGFGGTGCSFVLGRA